jgi:hypothetical protein
MSKIENVINLSDEDDILSLPTNPQDTSPTPPILQKLFKTPPETRTAIFNEFKYPLIVAVIFLALMNPLTDKAIHYIIGSDSQWIALAVKLIIVIVVFYIVEKNYHSLPPPQ